jgi:phosphohistidine swiveling domain-containing protein
VSWLSDIFRNRTGDDAVTILKLRTTRFRQLLRSYGTMLELLDDAAEKQGGGFVLDRQYVVALAEQIAELADAVVFDLNVVTSQQNLAFYDAVDRLRSELRGTLAQEPTAGPEARSERNGPGVGAAPVITPAVLAAALARAEVLYSECGQVARHGVAAGPVCNLEDVPAPGSVAAGSVLVATDLTVGEGGPAAIKQAGAILLDRGAVTDAAARLARELRIPTIMGLHTATSRLTTGTEVTVDADDNVVYLGRVAELLEYYRSERLAAEEEAEYRLLRLVRRAAFPLTLAPSLTEPALADCRTLRDVVHLAHSLAGDTLATVLGSLCGRANAIEGLAAAPSFRVFVSGLEGSADRGPDRSAAPLWPRGGLLGAFLDGLGRRSGPGRDGVSSSPPLSLYVAVRGEHIVTAATFPGGFDMLDATAGVAGGTNTVYCRFAPCGAGDRRGVRGELAAGVLTRFGFALAVTGREVSGWVHGLPSWEIEERVRAVACLFAALGPRDDAGWERAAVEPFVERFMRERPRGAATANGSGGERASGGTT